jgi:hypothetical protein
LILFFFASSAGEVVDKDGKVNSSLEKSIRDRGKLLTNVRNSAEKYQKAVEATKDKKDGAHGSGEKDKGGKDKAEKKEEKH